MVPHSTHAALCVKGDGVDMFRLQRTQQASQCLGCYKGLLGKHQSQIYPQFSLEKRMLPPGPAYLSPLPGMEGVEEKEKAHFIKAMQHKTWTHVLIWKANVTALPQPAGTL